ncbi:hypothetical protein JXO59_14195, partial [candidate division KSB1 bacterium]|nr:hypothetical protein [candidate division KSB1 bacterium]
MKHLILLILNLSLILPIYSMPSSQAQKTLHTESKMLASVVIGPERYNLPVKATLVYLRDDSCQQLSNRKDQLGAAEKQMLEQCRQVSTEYIKSRFGVLKVKNAKPGWYMITYRWEIAPKTRELKYFEFEDGFKGDFILLRYQQAEYPQNFVFTAGSKTFYFSGEENVLKIFDWLGDWHGRTEDIILVDVVNYCADRDIRKLSFQQLKKNNWLTQNNLEEIAKNAEAIATREEALSLLITHHCNYDVLIEMAEKENNKPIRKYAFDKMAGLHLLSDSVLVDLVNNSVYDDTRESALELLLPHIQINRDIVPALMKSRPEYIVRKKVTAKMAELGKEDVLYIIKNVNYQPVGESGLDILAERQLLDQPMLLDIAQHSMNRDVCLSAIAKIPDLSLLNDMAINHPLDDVRKDLARKIDDASTLSFIAQKDSVSSVRRAAVYNDHLSDETILYEIAVNDSDESVGKAATGKIKDQSLLAKIILSNELHEDIREQALGNSQDQEILAQVAQSDPKAWIRRAAVKNLTDQKVL